MAIVELEPPEGFTSITHWLLINAVELQYFNGSVPRAWDDMPVGCYPVVSANEPGQPRRVFALTTQEDLATVWRNKSPMYYPGHGRSHHCFYYAVLIEYLTMVDPDIV